MLEPMTGWACRDPPMARCPDPAEGDINQTFDGQDSYLRLYIQDQVLLLNAHPHGPNADDLILGKSTCAQKA